MLAYPEASRVLRVRPLFLLSLLVFGTVSILFISLFSLPPASAASSEFPSRTVNITNDNSNDVGKSVPIPPGVEKYVSITISNTQSVPTPAPFAQMVQVDSSAFASYEAPNLQNVEFFDSTGGIMKSWLESGNSYNSKNTVYWLELPEGLKPSSSMVAYMGFASPDANLLNAQTTGEAPQLSQVYGQYDDASGIFSYYQRFGGLQEMPGGWSSVSIPGNGNGTDGSSCQISFSQDRISVGGFGNSTKAFCSVYSLDPLPTPNAYPYLVDFYGSLYTTGSANTAQWGMFAAPAGADGNNEITGASYAIKSTGTSQATASTSLQFTNLDRTYQTNYLETNSDKVYSLSVPGQQTATLMVDYNTQFKSSALQAAPVGKVAFTVNSTAGSEQQKPISVLWIHSRPYPPQGVMPLVSLGKTFTKSTTIVKCDEPTIILGSSTFCSARVTGFSPNEVNPLSTQNYPNGTITWSGDDPKAFADSSTCKLVNGTCSVAYTPMSALTTALVASYSGDVYNAKSTGRLPVIIEKANTYMSAFCLPAEVPANSSTTCSAVVRGVIPSGPVTFVTSSPTGKFSPSSGQCLISVWGCAIAYSDSRQGSASLTASYIGDINNKPGSASTVLGITAPANMPEFPAGISLSFAMAGLAGIFIFLRTRSGK